MRKPIAVVSVSAVLLILWFTRGIYVGAEGRGKGDCIIGKLGDVNGDGVANVADPVYLLNWLFLSGPEPCACAQACDTCLTPEQAQMLDDIAFGRKVAGTYVQQTFGDFGEVIARGILTLCADGTASFDSQEEFGYWGEDIPDHFASSCHGTWIRTGPRAIRMRLTRINFLEDGTPLCVPGIFPVGTSATIASVSSAGYGASRSAPGTPGRPRPATRSTADSAASGGAPASRPCRDARIRCA